MSNVTLITYRQSGDTVDSQALSRAMADTARLNKQIYLPAGEGLGNEGVYLIGAEPGTEANNNLGNLWTTLHLYGDGIGKTRIKQSGNYTLLANSASSNIANNVRNIILTDFTIEDDVLGHGFNQTQHMIHLAGTTNVLIERVAFIGFRGDAIYVGSGPFLILERHNEKLVVRDCIFDGINKNNRNAISVLDAVDWTIENCLFQNCTRPGDGTTRPAEEQPFNPSYGISQPGPIDVEPNYVNNGVNNWHRIRDGRIRGCRFVNNGGNAVSMLLLPNSQFAQPIRKILVEACCIEGSAGGIGFLGYGGADATLQYDVRVERCLILNTPRPLEINGGFGFFFSDNHVEDANMSLLSGDTNRNVSILRNRVVRCGSQSGPTINQTSGSINLLINDNYFLDCGASGGGFSPIYFFNSQTADAAYGQLNYNRVDQVASPARTTSFANIVGGRASPPPNIATCEKIGTRFINFMPVNPDNYP